MPAAADWLTRFWAKVDQSAGPDSCWRWRGTHNLAGGTTRIEWTKNTRRPRFRLRAERRGHLTHAYVARIILSLDDGVPLDEREGWYACHKPGVCAHDWCINPQHLYWGTHEENVRDRYPMRAEGAGE